MTTRIPEIKIDRACIGPPDAAFNPTVALFVLTVAGYALGVVAALHGVVSVPLAVGWLGFCLYLGFTVLHEAMHGIAHRSKRIGNAMGRLWGLLLLVPMPLFRGVHHAHHAHTNDPERDPDLFCAAGPWFLRPLALLGVPLAYRWHFYTQRLWRDRASLRESVATDLALVAFFTWALAFGPAQWVLLLWLLPAALAVFCLALAFDYVPHYPLTQQGRYLDTRIYPGRIANLLLLGQNYHLIHHLWNTIPWYRYQQVFRAREQELRERGCPIGWAQPARADSAARSVASLQSA